MFFSFSADLDFRSIFQNDEPDWKHVLLLKGHPLNSLNLNSNRDSDNCEQPDLTYKF